MNTRDELAATLVEWATRDAAIGRSAEAAAAGPRLEYLEERCAHLEAELAQRDRTIAGLQDRLSRAEQSPLHRVVARLRAMRTSR